MFPNSLSPSRTSDYLQCPLLYRLKTIDRIPDSPSVAAIRGTLVHTVLEKLFEITPGNRSVAAAEDIFTQSMDQLAESSPDEYELLLNDSKDPVDSSRLASHAIKKVKPLLETYFTMEDPNRLEPFARELAVSVELTEDFVIRGFIDRVDKNLDGAIRVVDYKTGKAPSERFSSKAMFQMRFYALAWWRMTETIPTMLQLMYLGNGQFLRYQPDERDLINTENRILAIRRAIASSAENLDFPPAPSALCNWCSYKQFCPSFDGTPPLFPDANTWNSGSSLVEDALRSALPDEGLTNLT